MSSQEVDYQISIIEDKANPLMERREYKVEVASKTTPKRDVLRKTLASALKTPVERIFVKNVLTSYGTNVTVCKVHVYESAERAKAIEPRHIQLRNLSREERKQAMAAKPAEKSSEAPAAAQ